MSLSHMTKCNLIRAEGPTVCSVRLTTKTVPGIVFSLHSDSLNFIIYDGHTVLWSELGLRRSSEWYLISLWGHPFSSRGIKDHQCVTALMWSKAGEGGGGESADWLRGTLEILILSHCVHAGRWERAELNSPDRLLHLPHTELTPTAFIILSSLSMATFRFPPFPFLAGGIKFNGIVCDRYGVRFGTNLRQTTHNHFMVSFQLALWHVVVTRLTKTIQGEGLGGALCACGLKVNSPWKAPSFVPPSTTNNPVSLQASLADFKNCVVCSLRVFMLVLWSPLQRWHPGATYLQ